MEAVAASAHVAVTRSVSRAGIMAFSRAGTVGAGSVDSVCVAVAPNVRGHVCQPVWVKVTTFSRWHRIRHDSVVKSASRRYGGTDPRRYRTLPRHVSSWHDDGALRVDCGYSGSLDEPMSSVSAKPVRDGGKGSVDSARKPPFFWHSPAAPRMQLVPNTPYAEPCRFIFSNGGMTFKPSTPARQKSNLSDMSDTGV